MSSFWQILLKALLLNGRKKHCIWFNNGNKHLKICCFYTFTYSNFYFKSTFMQAVKPCITTTNESTTTLMYFPLKQSTIKTPEYVCNTLQMFLFFINGFNFTCFLSFYLLSFIFLLCSCIRFPFFLLKPISSSLQWQNFPTGINKVSSLMIRIYFVTFCFIYNKT